MPCIALDRQKYKAKTLAAHLWRGKDKCPALKLSVSGYFRFSEGDSKPISNV